MVQHSFYIPKPTELILLQLFDSSRLLHRVTVLVALIFTTILNLNKLGGGEVPA